MKGVFETLRYHARTRPHAVAFSGDGATLTWEQLAGRVAELSRRLEGAPHCVAIGLAGGCDYVVADLALALTGRRQVPLPFFFGAEQLGHVVADAKPRAVITDRPEAFADVPGLRVIPPVHEGCESAELPPYQPGGDRVIYTSGSSGRPKGVVIGARQMAASLAALMPLVGATDADLHLSVLPLAQLLEQICGIYLPILAGAETRFDFAATRTLFQADIAPLTQAFARVRPTTSLLAPGVLGRWVADLRQRGSRAPSSLRFVAVGGAASAPALLESAWSMGIPVHEGYGLSECCAVVAMNRPGDNVIGSAGEILSGLDVRIEEGEITVAGPTVMQGYLNGDPAPVRWRTGDLGRIEQGRLFVEGRKDALLITPNGRNISPEWIEQRVNADPRVLSSGLGLRADGALVLVVAAVAPIGPIEISHLLSDLPAYARPAELIVTSPSEPGLLFPAGTPNRKTVAALVNERAAVSLSPAIESLAS